MGSCRLAWVGAVRRVYPARGSLTNLPRSTREQAVVDLPRSGQFVENTQLEAVLTNLPRSSRDEFDRRAVCWSSLEISAASDGELFADSSRASSWKSCCTCDGHVGARACVSLGARWHLRFAWCSLAPSQQSRLRGSRILAVSIDTCARIPVKLQ